MSRLEEWDIVVSNMNNTTVWESELISEINETNNIWANETVVPLFQFPLAFQVTVHILYSLVFILGLLGNLLVCYLVLCTAATKTKTVTNGFLFNLALGDLLILSLCLPFGYLSVLHQYWPFGELLCYVTAPAKAIGVFVSSYTLVALTVDRYMTILNPLKPRLGLRQCILIIIIIWLAAVITAIPIGVFTVVEVHEESGLPRCGEFGWKTPTEELTYNLVLMILQYFFPVAVLSYCYTIICNTVWGKGGLQPRRNLNGRQTNLKFSNGKRKTVVMSLLLTSGFALAWLPYTAIYLVLVHFPEITEEDWFPYLYLMCHWLAMANSLYNPLIYVWINKRFRTAFLEIVCRRFSTPPVTGSKHWLWSYSWRSASSSTRKHHPNMDKNSCKKLMTDSEAKQEVKIVS